MSETTGINYVDHTFNPWWGCTHAGSPGCDNCYARRDAHHWGKECFDSSPRLVMSDATWNKPLAWNRKAAKEGVKRRVLCGSMCDIFENAPELYKPRERLWKLISATPSLFWMLITKRPENTDALTPGDWGGCNFPSNVGLGVTVETQDQLWRVNEVMFSDAPLLWVSHEPALGKVTWPDEFLALGKRALIVTGGETGPKARPMHPDIPRHDRYQCVEAGVAFWFKQWGEWVPAMRVNTEAHTVEEIGHGAVVPRRSPANQVGTRLLDGREWNELPEVAR